MKTPAILLGLSLAAGAALLLMQEPLLGDLMLLVAVVSLASLLLLAGAFFRGRRKWIVLDGSNIMHWTDETPALETVSTVLRWLESRGYRPAIWFDANVGYKVGNRYFGPRELARRLGIPASRVSVAPKGTPADPLLLKDAMRKRARVVSNDRFRDWEDQFPKLREEGFVVRTSLDGGRLVLKL